MFRFLAYKANYVNFMCKLGALTVKTQHRDMKTPTSPDVRDTAEGNVGVWVRMRPMLPHEQDEVLPRPR